MQDRIPQILLVDDDKQVHVGLTATFRSLQYNLICVEGAEEAKKRLAEKEPEAMICDVMMPGISGLALLQFVRQKHPMVPVIMLTGQANQDRLLQAFRLGAVDYLFKPVNHAGIERTLDKALRDREQRIEALRLQRELERFTSLTRRRGLDVAISHDWETNAVKKLVSALDHPD